MDLFTNCDILKEKGSHFVTVVIGLDGWTNQGYTLSFLSERPLRHEMEIALRLLASGLTGLPSGPFSRW